MQRAVHAHLNGDLPTLEVKMTSGITDRKCFPALTELLTPTKFLPVYLERKSLGRIMPPHSVELHLTARCNFRCLHCSYAKRNAERAQVPPELADRLIADLTGPLRPQGVYFSGGGEPTTMSGWEEYMARCLDAGIQTALVTNGSLLREKHWGLLARLSYMAVSIHSPEPATHARITGGPGFAAQFTIPGKVKAAGTGVIVGARCVLNGENYAQALGIYRAAMDAGYDYVIFIPAVDYEARGLALPHEQTQTLERIAAEGDFDEDATNFKALARRGFGYYASGPGVPGTVRDAGDCHATRLGATAFVNYDSQVYLCQPNIGRREMAIGGLRKEPLSVSWGGVRHRAVIEDLCGEHRAGGCVNCRALAYNRAVYEYEITPANQPVTMVKDAFL